MNRWDLRRVLLAVVIVWAAGLVLYVAANLDFGWALGYGPNRFHWPDLPLFHTREETTANGQQQVLYTVPTRTLTPQEISDLQRTNAATVSPSAGK